MSASLQHVILSAAKDPSAPNTASRGFFAALRMTIPRGPSLPARAAGGLIWLYQWTLSPALAALNPTCGCRFAPTCSHYAREALREHGVLAGGFLTIRRLLKCGPWHPGGEDPVPSRKFYCVRSQFVGAQTCCAPRSDGPIQGRSKSAPLPLT